MTYKNWRDAWKRVGELGYMSHCYEWDEEKQGYIVRRMTAAEIRRSNKERTALQKAYDDSLPAEHMKMFR